MSIWLSKLKSNFGGFLTSPTEIPAPEVVSGPGCVTQIADLCARKGFKTVLIVTDEGICKMGLLDSTLSALKSKGVKHILFDKVTDPTISQCEKARDIYLKERCQAIIAFGGGSSMDCAKCAAWWSTDPSRDFKQCCGSNCSVDENKMPCLIAVPTTAGTGSENSAACIVTWPEEKKKCLSVDVNLIPKFVFLDPKLLESLPQGITAASGIIALTHAVESYVSPWRSEQSMKLSKCATVDVFNNLVENCNNPKNLDAREKLQRASFDAGGAFTRAGLGYVHAMAHQLGGLYRVPQGVAHGLLLPIVLEYYLSTPTNSFIVDSYAELMLAVRNQEGKKVSCDERQTLAREFVASVRKLTKDVGIPEYAKNFPASMVENVAQGALSECHGNMYSFFEMPRRMMWDCGFPVPKHMNLEQSKDILSRIIDPTIISSRI